MSEIPTWSVGNRNPSITETIVDDNEDPIDLNSPASTVRFKARLVGSAVGSTPIVDQPATIVQTGSGGSAVDKGAVRYDWSAGDIATNGILADEHRALVWWEVTTGAKTQDLMEALIAVDAHGQPATLTDQSYVELEEFKNTLTLTATTFTDLDGKRALVAASRAVDYITGQRFYQDTVDQTRYYTATRQRTIRIDPLVSLTSLQTSWDGINFDTTLAVDTDFILEPRSAPQDGVPYTALRRQNYEAWWGFDDRFRTPWPMLPESIKVTGKFGWAEVPAGVKHATQLIASRFFKVSREAPWGVVGFDEAGAVRISRYIPDQELALGMYMRRKLLV